MSQLRVEFGAWLNRVVTRGSGHQRLLRCPIRNRDLVDAPEERIRQALLYFLLDLQSTARFLLAAERDRHDIDLRWVPPEDFSPPVPPLLIIETKVDQVAGGSTNAQLQRYLEESDGDCGVVFTGERMWQVIRVGSVISQRGMTSLRELAVLVESRSQRDPFKQSIDDFCAARIGDIDALGRLAKTYRHATFVLSISGHEAPYTYLNVDDAAVRCRPANQFVRKPLAFPRHNVERLIRVFS